MKKFAFLFVAISAISFASCGNGTQACTECSDSDTVAVDTVDTTAVDSVVAEVVDTVAAVVAE
ncbi:MAG: hypothetical protein HUK02_05695 [Bacteroidaceae bacterium]|nr:hypothetical protein [Bacteroidaceae bacterium]